MITTKEKITYWCRFYLIIISWFLVSFFGFISTLVVWAFILKHYFKVKTKFWLLNDTKDGDFGAEWWLIKNNLKPGLWSAFLWWFRNHSWNYISKFKPAGTADRDKIKVLWPEEARTDLELYADLMKWSHRKERLYDKREIYYVANNKIYGRFSWANKYFTFQQGAGGDRYKFMFIPIWPFLLLIAIIVLLLKII